MEEFNMFENETISFRLKFNLRCALSQMFAAEMSHNRSASMALRNSNDSFTVVKGYFIAVFRWHLWLLWQLLQILHDESFRLTPREAFSETLPQCLIFLEKSN